MVKTGGKMILTRIHHVTSGNETCSAQRDLTNLKQLLLKTQYRAAKSCNWLDYQAVLELQDFIHCREEIAEKYPYDGKSSFSELLNEALQK